MNTFLKPAALLMFAAVASMGSADELAESRTSPAVVLPQLILPEAAPAVELGVSAVGSENAPPREATLMAIAAWLSFEFDLPRIDKPPAVAFAPVKRMIGLRYRDVPSDRWGGGSGSAPLDTPGEPPDIVAIYDSEAKTIYLREGWSGETPGEFSEVVHEMVHHIQSVAGLKFACPEERERMAFEAQERWLRLFGTDLEAEFGLDPFTVLVRSNCLY